MIRNATDAHGAELVLDWHTPSVQSGSGIVVATGVFDLLHVGHVRFLAAASAAGRRLVVGVEDDQRTRARKGPSRPLIPVGERCELLAALSFVDGVFAISGPPTLAHVPAYTRLLAALAPSTIAFTAGDPAAEGKRLVATALRAQVLEVGRVEARSTSLLIDRLLARRDAPRLAISNADKMASRRLDEPVAS